MHKLLTLGATTLAAITLQTTAIAEERQEITLPHLTMIQDSASNDSVQAINVFYTKDTGANEYIYQSVRINGPVTMIQKNVNAKVQALNYAGKKSF